MRFKRTAAAVLAAVTAVSAASVCAFAEENKAELATLDFADVHGMTGAADLGDGYILYYDDSNYIRGIVHLEKNDNGELTYTDVESDLDFSKNLTWWTGKEEYIQLVEQDADGNVTKRYVVHIDKTNNKATTAYTFSAGWCYTLVNGYTVADGDSDSYVIYNPNGKVITTINSADPNYGGIAAASGDGKYVAYYISVNNEHKIVDERDGLELTARDYNLYGIGKDGNMTELKAIEEIDGLSFASCGDDYVILFESVRPYLKRVFVDINTGNVIDDVLFDSCENEKIYNNLIITKIVGNYRLYDTNTKNFVGENTYQFMSTADDGKTYLVQNADGKWGYLDAKGNEIGEWYDNAGAFYGDYAPVIKDGKGYLIDRNFNRVSEMVDATTVGTLTDDLFYFANGDSRAFVTYNGAVSAPADTSKPDDTSKPSDSTSTPSAEKDNPETGAKGVALTLGLAAIAGAAAVVYRKKK